MLDHPQQPQRTRFPTVWDHQDVHKLLENVYAANAKDGFKLSGPGSQLEDALQHSPRPAAPTAAFAAF